MIHCKLLINICIVYTYLHKSSKCMIYEESNHYMHILFHNLIYFNSYMLHSIKYKFTIKTNGFE